MNRRRAVTERQVRQQYILVKSHAPNVADLYRDIDNSWLIGDLRIGDTCREAYQFLQGLRAGILSAPFLNQKAG